MIKHGKLMLVVILVMMLSFVNAGCWDNKELSERTIVLGAGFDVLLGGERGALVTVEFPKFVTGGSEAGKIEPKVSSESGPSLFQAIRHFTLHLGKKLFWGNVAVLIVGEDFAREGLFALVDFYVRDQELRLSPYLLVAKGSRATEVINGLKGETSTLGSQQILATMEGQAATGEIRARKVKDFLQQLNTEGIQPSLAVIEREGGSKSYTVKGTAVFKQDQLVGWLNTKETRGLNWLSGDIKGGLLNVDYEGKKEALTLEIFRASVTKKAELSMDEEIIYQPEISVVVNIAELNQPVDISAPGYLDKVKKAAAVEIEKEAQLAFKMLQQLKSDAIGVGHFFYQNNTQHWQEVKGTWDDEVFPRIKLQPKIEVTVKRSNLILKRVQVR
ncbi:Ger(x)C family spore germination protein [Metallumcola ferriviriculae]|uniref:Ger(X)C family spore germination protein n=1 Tax=Metallumcola ferriviriculae TaxID=3039180 RepID=A0AAU0UL71_9FIRM|nr:Ger(x)C family spore germination protein [Desulfitibacteraceae bacterium MK1]